MSPCRPTAPRKLTFTGSTDVAAACVERPRSSSCTRRWSSAATRRSSSSRTRTSTPPSTAPWWRRCATSARPARPRTGSTSTRAVAPEFTDRLAERMAALRVGRGTEPGVQVGPMIDRLEGQDRDAGRRGGAGRGRRRGRRRALEGRVGSTRRRCSRRRTGRALLEEEIFGPVAPSRRSQTLDEASTWRTPPSTASSPTRSPATWTAPCAWPSGSTPGWSAINQGVVSNPAAPFGGVKASGLGAREAARGSRSTWRRRYVGIRPR